VAANAAAETPKANASRRVISFVIKFSLFSVPGVESPVNSQPQFQPEPETFASSCYVLRARAVPRFARRRSLPS